MGLEKDIFILIGMAALFSGLAISEGYYIDPAFYSMAGVIWIVFAYFV
jgi:hypothetical protein